MNLRRHLFAHTLLICTLLLCRNRIPRPIVASPSGKPLPAPQPEVKAETETHRLESTQRFRERNDQWRVENWMPNNYEADRGYVRFYRTERLVQAFKAEELGGYTLELGKVAFATRFPVIVIRAQPMCGNPGQTTLFSLRQGRLLRMGEVGGENGGPVFRDIDRDGRPEWMFDDYDWYRYYGKRPKSFLVYKERQDGTLHLWKRLPNRHRNRLPGRLGLAKWDI